MERWHLGLRCAFNAFVLSLCFPSSLFSGERALSLFLYSFFSYTYTDIFHLIKTSVNSSTTAFLTRLSRVSSSCGRGEHRAPIEEDNELVSLV